MAVVACASRFAVLKLDDEISESLNKKNAPPSNQAGKNKTNQKGTTETKSKPKKKKKNANEIAELQNLAFGTPSSKKHKSSNNSKSGQASAKQWEEWKQKDSMIVSEAYEQDLQEALLMSKIDYEEKKDVYDALAKEAELNKLGLPKKKKKNNQKKDKGIMSLDEFQSLDSNNKHLGLPKESDEFELPLKSIPIEDANFFNKIEEDAEKIINKEQKQDKHKPVDPIKESARFHQYQEDLNTKDKEISVLKENVAKLKEELKNVKLRNKKLLGILESGEMREKAEILVQIDQLLAVKDELTEQVSEYHTSLEQERSKVHALQMELKKCQNSKKQRTESK